MLYFENLSSDSTYAFLADGLTEELIVRLGEVGRLDVRSRFAVRRYRGRVPDDPAAVGRVLDVGYLVIGSVRPGRGRVRVTAEVVQTGSGARVWGGAVDRPSDDLLAVTDTVAQIVAQGIVGRLAPHERAALAVRTTRSPRAFEHFLRGNYALAERAPRAVLQALDEYQAAERLDPAFTAARARAAYAYVLLLAWHWPYPGLSPDSVLARGVADVDRALQQDSASSDAWMAKGILLWFVEPRTFQGVVAAHERSVALDSGNAEAWNLLGVALMIVGRDSAATVALRRALAIEPGRQISLMRLAELAWMARDYGGAMRILDTLLASAPGFYYASMDRVGLWLHAGDTAAARRDAELSARIGADDYEVTRATLAWVQAVEGDTVRARRGVDSVLALADGPTGVNLAVLPAVLPAVIALGDTARALDIVERVQPRGPFLWDQLRWPPLEPLWAIPRYRRVVEDARPVP